MNNDRTKIIPSISIIAPVYNEEDSLSKFFAEIIKVISKITKDWEIICVNDGSDDKSLEILTEQNTQDDRIKIITFSRNFGKEIALTAGLQHSSKDVVVPIDSDLQDPPELISQMVEKWQEGFDVVLATRDNRNNDSFIKRTTANLFYKILKKVSNIDIPSNTGDYRLMDKKVVETINLCPEKTRFMKGLFAWAGYKTTAIMFERPERIGGSPKQNYKSLFRLAFDGIFSFSTIPLQIWTFIGVIIASISFFYASLIIIGTIIFGTEVDGYASTITIILFMGGIQLISLGVLGEYISRIYREVKQRPLYVIDKKIGLDK